MRIEDTERIVTDRDLKDLPGSYDLSRVNARITFKGQTYTYLSSGLQREVYRSECGKWVIKVPIAQLYDDSGDKALAAFLGDGPMAGREFALPYTFLHNWHEANAYAECPKHLRKHLPPTQYVKEFGWVRQRYVEVYRTFADADMIECGVYKGRVVMFDMDALLRDFNDRNTRSDSGYNYYCLPRLIKASEARLVEMGIKW